VKALLAAAPSNSDKPADLDPGARDLKLVRRLGPWRTVDSKTGQLKQGFSADFELKGAVDVDDALEDWLEGPACHPTMRVRPTEPPEAC
jgi:hypothetical protein